VRARNARQTERTGALEDARGANANADAIPRCLYARGAVELRTRSYRNTRFSHLSPSTNLSTSYDRYDMYNGDESLGISLDSPDCSEL